MTARVLISGFVQGVGFRAFVKSKASELGLKGFVKNTEDGKVEAVLQGRINDIEKMILLCRKGPFLSEVKDIEVKWMDKDSEYASFDIIH